MQTEEGIMYPTHLSSINNEQLPSETAKEEDSNLLLLARGMDIAKEYLHSLATD